MTTISPAIPPPAMAPNGTYVHQRLGFIDSDWNQDAHYMSNKGKNNPIMKKNGTESQPLFFKNFC